MSGHQDLLKKRINEIQLQLANLKDQIEDISTLQNELTRLQRLEMEEDLSEESNQILLNEKQSSLF